MKSPLPIFDDIKHIDDVDLARILSESNNEILGDYTHALAFLKAYKGSQGTFNSYRREIERLLHWCTFVAEKPLNQLKREDIEHFIYFCQKPLKSWIGTTKVPRFIKVEGIRSPNPQWRPFIATVSKAAYQKGERPISKDFNFTQSSVKETFAILSTFYNYLLQEEYVYMNPVALIRQKSKFIQKSQSQPKIRRLSDLQWDYVMTTAKEMAETHPEAHERTLFLLSALYSMYLRISELTASPRWIPLMNHFHRDSDNNWWFTTVGKGNKKRQIAVSDTMLEALKRWRQFLGLSSLPSPADQSPLIPKTKGQGPITNTSYIRKIVQYCFDQTTLRLINDNHHEEAESLTTATVHWLRHTGISDDVKHRPREHVRDDAGHGSGAITDRYIDVELKARHRTAKNKLIHEN
ncbi:MAG: Phage integrase family protein [Gammaproteobacteria bacterium]|jgi:site-specific recombinase XerD|nr:Phage integrase family protein [Gammaproteobacteria bacterium]